MAGWFSETGDEKRIRLMDERKAADREVKRKKRVEKRLAQRAELQKEIDAEVARNMDYASPEAKKDRLDKLQGRSSLMNGALGQEFAYKGSSGHTPWMKSPGLDQGIGRAKVERDSKPERESQDKSDLKAASFTSIRLARPY